MNRRAAAGALAAAAVLLLAGGLRPQASAARHPLDPPDETEIRAATAALRAAGRLTEGRRIAQLELVEPPKARVLSADREHDQPRHALATVHDRSSGETFQAAIDVAGGKVLDWQARPGVQPALYQDDFYETSELVRADPRWRAAVARRGVANANHVQIEAAPVGFDGTPVSHRLVHAVSYLRGSSLNPYARPLDGLVATVDLTAKKVTALMDDPAGDLPPPPARDFMAGAARPAAATIEDPAARHGFVRNGHQVRWGPWQFHYAVHPREGVVLSVVEYDDGAGARPVLYKASIAEVLVIYADPGAGWAFRSVFDEGEYGLGHSLTTLDAGGDVPADAELIDAMLADSTGRPHRVARVVGIYARDAGLAWRHTDYMTGRMLAARKRQLVVASVATVANYDYTFNWVFDADGTIELEVLLTGVLQAGAARNGHGGDGHADAFAHRVDRGLRAVHHQHFFNVRLDVDVDGQACNALVELEAAPSPRMQGHGAAFSMNNRVVPAEGPLELNAARGRRWRVVNWGVRNPLGEPVGYTLVPGEGSVPQTRPDAWIRRRARFLDAPVWVTPYDAAQRYPAGEFVNQSAGADGVAAWTKAARSVAGQDLVLWHTIGVTHLPRPEEWPIMPVYRAGFRLIPSGFMAGAARTPAPCRAPARQH